VELCVLVPDRWKHYGRWRHPEKESGENQTYRLEVGKVRWPWVGPAQFYLHWYPKFTRLVEAFKPDVIDLWEEPWALVSAHACRIRNRAAPKALILSETEQNIAKRLPPPFELLRSYTLKNADWVVGRSEEALAVTRAKGYLGQASVVPNAVDAKLFRPMNKQECRSRYGLSGFVVGFIGRLVAEKGVEDLLAALKHCTGEVTLVFAGDGPMLPLLRKSAEANGHAARVRFMGNVTFNELPTLMNALDVLVLPSRTTSSWKEQFGRVIIEAHACSVPVIGSGSGAIPDVVGQGGIVVPENSPTSLAQAISVLERDRRRANDLGAAGLARVHSEYTWEVVARKMAEIYQTMLARDSVDKQSRRDSTAKGHSISSKAHEEPALRAREGL
jgi:glycosyltransferase involved in cell wall biosynthesis